MSAKSRNKNLLLFRTRTSIIKYKIYFDISFIHLDGKKSEDRWWLAMTKNKFVTSLAKCSPHIFISSCSKHHGRRGCGLCPFFNIFEGSWLRFSVSPYSRQNPITYTQSHISNVILSNKMYCLSCNKFLNF